MSAATVTPYSLADVPTAPSGSRFWLATAPSGFPAIPSDVFALALRNLLAARIDEASAFRPAKVECSLQAVVRREDGSYELIDRGAVSGVPVYAGRRPGRVWRGYRGNPGRVIDELFLGLENGAFGRCPDGMAWKCAREVAELHGLAGKALRELNDSLCQLLALRCGLLVERSMLPPIVPGASS